MHTLERSHRTMRQADVRIQQNSSLGSLSWCSWRHRCKDSCNRDSCHHLAVINRCVQAICFPRCYHMPRPLKVCGLFLFFKKKKQPKTTHCPWVSIQEANIALCLCCLLLVPLSYVMDTAWAAEPAVTLAPSPACYVLPSTTSSHLIQSSEKGPRTNKPNLLSVSAETF